MSTLSSGVYTIPPAATEIATAAGPVTGSSGNV
jgi:hypothetical protein